MESEESGMGTVVKKSRKLLDGSNLYRKVTVETDAGATKEIRVDRAVWKELAVGDRVDAKGNKS